MSDATTTASMAQINTGTIVSITIAATIFSAFSIVVVCLLRSWSNNRRLRHDLESRCIQVPQFGVKTIGTARPGKYRTVLTKRGGSYMPYLSKTDWDHLDSVDSLAYNGLAEGAPALEKYEPLRKPQRSFMRRAFKREPVQLRSVKKSVLPPVLEATVGMEYLSNSPSPPPPREPRHGAGGYGVANTSTLLSLDGGAFPEYMTSPFTTAGSEMRDERLKPQPLFSKEPPNYSLSEPPLRVRKKRSETINVYGGGGNNLKDASPTKTQNHTRSISLGSQKPGLAPKVPVPPLPLFSTDKGERCKSHLSTTGIPNYESQQSVSSLESIGSSVLANTSPRISRTTSARTRQGHKRDFNGSGIIGPRAVRKARSQNLHHQVLTWSGQKYLDPKAHGVNRHSLSSSIRDSMNSRPQSIIEEPEFSDLVTQSSFLEPPQMAVVASKKPAKARLVITPRGSPLKPPLNTKKELTSGSKRSPSRSPESTSLDSTRSSNGNPFHWDPSPMNLAKTSSMRGSPTKRHQRKRTGVRFSKPPATVEKSPSASMTDIVEESTPEQMGPKPVSPSSSPRPLPRPPSVSTFEPDIDPSLTSLRATLTPSSPGLQLAGYSHDIGLGGVFGLEETIDSPTIARMSSMSRHEIPDFPWPASNGAVATFRFINESNTTVNGESSMADYWAKDLVDFGDEDTQLVDQATCSSQTLSDAGELEPWRLQPGEALLSLNEVHSSGFLDAMGSTQALLKESPPCSPKSQPLKPANIVLSPLDKIARGSALSIQKIDQEQGDGDELIGPDDSQAKTSPIRQSISALRRMNSDAKEDNDLDPGMKGTERYFNVGPVSRKRGAEREGSWMSLIGQKFRSRSKMDLTPMPHLSVQQNGDSSANLMDTGLHEVDLTDPVSTLEQDDTVPELAWPSKSALPSTVSIWEDGQNYWSDQSSIANLSIGNGGLKALGSSTPLKVNIQPPSNEGTPRSLYDQKGFLVENSPNR